jgi:hypothetical protein
VNSTVDNDSNQNVERIASDRCDGYFIELCALSTSDALTAEEWRQLELHLSICPSCRETKAQYEAVIATTLTAMAAEHAQLDDDHTSDPWSVERAEASLMQRIERENISPDERPQALTPSSRWRLPWRYAGAAIFAVVSSFAAYHLGMLHGRSAFSSSSQTISHTDDDQTTRGGIRAVGWPATGNDEHHTVGEVMELRHRLQTRLSDIGAIEGRMKLLQGQLAEQATTLENNSQSRADLEKQLSLAQSTAQGLQDKLDLAATQVSHDVVQSQLLQEQINDLRTSVQQKEREIAQREELLQHDRDIRNLISACDLYIAEVYDVAKSGKTQKAYGRVFYTKGKSLVFYAYDLDQQPGVKLASTFQAWGRKGFDQPHDINLGIFYQDDQNKERWVLKSDDPVTLSQIDTVFVTVEPHGESVKPSGKPLLFTYLRLSPNHP